MMSVNILNGQKEKKDRHRKFVALEEALNFVDLILDDSSLPQSDRELATNLRHSNIRRLFSQFDEMRDIQFGEWFKYLDMLNTRCESEINTCSKKAHH